MRIHGKIKNFARQGGLYNRVVLCWLIGLLSVLVINTRNFDLHFTWRGPQKVATQIVIANVPNTAYEIDEAVRFLRENNPSLIVAVVNRKESSFFTGLHDVGLIPRKSFKPDPDGIIRALKIPDILHERLKVPASYHADLGRSFINFRGPQNTFLPIYFYELKSQKILPSLIQDKIVILNLEDPENEPFATPVGDLTPSEILATMIDNILLNRWIVPLSFWISAIVQFALTVAVAGIIFLLSANLAFIGIFIVLLITSSMSFLLFDQFYIWVPLTSYCLQIVICYLVFVNYKLGKKEQFAWRLEKERTYRSEMDEMKKNFLNLFSHDLKTPIAKILGQVEIMEGQLQSPEKIKDGTGKIRRYSNELNQYVKNILKISQIESDRFQIKREPCDVNSIVEQAAVILKPLADEKSIQIEMRLEPLFSIKCDKELLQQIVLNILENAIKYSPDGSRVKLLSQEENDFVIVSVTDQGKGIRPEDQITIWQKFSRLNEQNEGTGLGLYLVKYFVEAHNGAVFIDSTPGAGSTIGFKLPMS